MLEGNTSASHLGLCLFVFFLFLTSSCTPIKTLWMLPKLHPCPLFAVNRSRVGQEAKLKKATILSPPRGPDAQPLLALPSFLPEGRQVELLLSGAHLLIYIPSHVAIPAQLWSQSGHMKMIWIKMWYAIPGWLLWNVGNAYICLNQDLWFSWAYILSHHHIFCEQSKIIW